MLLALREDCRYCTESASFYERLAREARVKQVRVIALLPQAPRPGYLEGLGLGSSETRLARFSDLNVHSTPTLLLVDAGGRVKRVWVGKMPPQKESEVLAALHGAAASPPLSP